MADISARIEPHGGVAVIGWQAQLDLPVSSMYSSYRIERTLDLINWQTVAGPLSGGVGVSDELLRQALPATDALSFYRIVADRHLSTNGAGGDAIYGYATEFSKELQLLGQLSLDQFSSGFSSTNAYVSQVSFDPTDALYWSAFQSAGLALNSQELALFQTNGFVVSQRLGSYSFADAFYRLFTNHLPVFVSADAVMHAWHRSYMTMLEEVEETFLAPTLEQVIRGMQLQIINLNQEAASGALANAVLDSDFFLAVARSLVTGTNNSGVLGQSARVSAARNAINALVPAQIEIFGANRVVDFSQFQVRGHYTTSPRLQRYFRAWMWCGLIDFRFTGGTNDNSQRELSGAIAMDILLNRSGLTNNWKLIDDLIRMFVGNSDALSFPQLNDLLLAASIQSPADVPTTASLQSLQSRIMSGQIGVQQISSGYLYSPLTPQQLKLPRSFAFCPQRFVIDGWALDKVVFDSILWDTNGIPEFTDKVPRRNASALDVAFSVFGNDQVVPDVVARIATPSTNVWRDGWPYQHNLAAVRNVINRQDPGSWTNNMYMAWLGCLRQLSANTAGAQYPQAVRTRNWGMRTLNTQLASWTELKHDTVLYAKQPYSQPVSCAYPMGYVDPNPAFWSSLVSMATSTMRLVALLPTNGTVALEGITNQDKTPYTVSLATLQRNRLGVLSNFVNAATTLAGIAQNEIANVEFSGEEIAFLQNTIDNQSGYTSGTRKYTGWYPALFYRPARHLLDFGRYEGSDAWDGLVTDVLTDAPDAVHGDPGSILHEAVGTVNLLMVTIDCDTTNRVMYAGPVLSHYEFQLGPTTRRTDDEWKSQVVAGQLPEQPDWTKGYLAPGTYTFPAGCCTPSF